MTVNSYHCWYFPIVHDTWCINLNFEVEIFRRYATTVAVCVQCIDINVCIVHVIRILWLGAYLVMGFNAIHWGGFSGSEVIGDYHWQSHLLCENVQVHMCVAILAYKEKENI